MASYWHEFLALAVIHFLAVVAPGPDFAVTIRQSLRFGRAVGVWTALGIGAGISVHVLYTLLGVSALLHTTPWLMQAAQFLGCAYLLYLGISFLRSKGSGASVAQEIDGEATVSTQSTRKAFVTGFMTNATNPKATLFFLAVFTSIVSTETPLTIQFLYGVWMCVVNAAWFVCVSMLFTSAPVRDRFIRITHYVDKCMGVLLIIFALRLLFLPIVSH